MSLDWRLKTRTDGRCEYGGCGTPSYSYRSGTPKEATTLVVFIPKDPAREKTSPVKTHRVCNQHRGILKRADDYYYVLRFHSPIPGDVDATVATEVKDLRATQAENKRAYEDSIRRRLPEERKQFFGPARKDSDKMATLMEPDTYGLRHIRVEGQGEYRYATGLTPAEAESLAYRLLALAAEARNAANMRPEELS